MKQDQEFLKHGYDIENYDLEDPSVVNIVKMQQILAVKLADLVLKHSKDRDNFAKNDIFSIFVEATKVVTSCMENSFKKIIKNKEKCLVCGEKVCSC